MKPVTGRDELLSCRATLQACSEPHYAQGGIRNNLVNTPNISLSNAFRVPFCAANGLTISIPTTEVVVFGEGHHDCAWKVAGQHLKRSKSFTYLGMRFHEDGKIRHAVQARFSKACASVGSI